MSDKRRAGMVFILITIFLDVLGLGIVIPVVPELVVEFLEGDASRAAAWYGLLVSSFALAQFAFAPVLGALSDRFGRRPVLLLSLAGFGLNYVVMALAPTLWWLFLGRVLSGVTGASFTTANAYVADVSTPSDRARNYGLVGAAFGLGFVFGPAIGGVLGHLGPRVPFWVASAIVGANWLYGLFVLPESFPPAKRRTLSLADANPLSGIGHLRRYPLVAGLAVVFVFVSLAQRSLETIWVLYTHYRFGWEERDNGLTLALVGVMAAVVQGGLVRGVVARLGERQTILASLVVSTLAFLLYGLATHGWMMLVIIVVASLGAMAQPAVQALVAEAVPSSEQGAVQGALTALISLTAIIAPLGSSQLFTAFTGDGAVIELPGSPFFAGSALMLVALWLAARLFRGEEPATPALVPARARSADSRRTPGRATTPSPATAPASGSPPPATTPASRSSRHPRRSASTSARRPRGRPSAGRPAPTRGRRRLAREGRPGRTRPSGRASGGVDGL